MWNRRISKRPYDGRVQHATALRRPRRWIKYLCAVTASGILFSGTGWALVNHDLNHQIKSNNGAQKLLRRAPRDTYNGRPVNILVIGTDTRAGDNATLTNNDDATQRSDTTMLVHISKNRSRVQVVSIPRDTKVTIPECYRTDGSTSPTHPDTQFNWAYSYGAGENGDISGALACTWKTVEKLTDLRIDEAVIVDFSGFQKMVDALGGINVYVPTPIKDHKNSGLVIPDPGCFHFNGSQALSYARVRKGITGGDGSDYQRIERQQEVMGIMMRTALEKNIFGDLASLYGFLRAGLSSLTLTAGLDSTQKLAGFGWSLHSLRPENLQFTTMPVREDPRDTNRLLVDEPLAERLWKNLSLDKPFPVGLQIRDANGDVYEVTAKTPKKSDLNASEHSENPNTSSDQVSSNKNKQPTDPTGTSGAQSNLDNSIPNSESKNNAESSTEIKLKKIEQKVPKGSTATDPATLEILKYRCHLKHFD